MTLGTWPPAALSAGCIRLMPANALGGACYEKQVAAVTLLPLRRPFCVCLLHYAQHVKPQLLQRSNPHVSCKLGKPPPSARAFVAHLFCIFESLSEASDYPLITNTTCSRPCITAQACLGVADVAARVAAAESLRQLRATGASSSSRSAGSNTTCWDSATSVLMWWCPWITCLVGRMNGCSCCTR